MILNKLETQLKKICDENPEYNILYSTWNLNKKICIEALKNVLITYPHYSMHDDSHSETVISNIEMLLGDRIEKLSPTDIWLLLHASYCHDLGMILPWENQQELLKTNNFQKHIKKLSESRSSDLQEAAEYILNLKEKLNNNNNFELSLKIYKYIILLNSSYFRSKHAELSNEYITKNNIENINLIKPRLIKLLGKICELHTANTEEILKLDYQTNGFGNDYAHPRFIATFLRLGDVLDADNNRFNETSIKTIEKLPNSSQAHKDKHQATTHILITPNEIQLTSDCPTNESYRETQNLISSIENEVNFLTINWKAIMPKNIGGYAPIFNKKETFNNGVKDIDETSGLKFQISQSKAFEIIEGSNIYDDKFVFIREIIQNAIDATKIQLWRDLKSENYIAWVDINKINNLQPYDIPKEIFKNYPINVRLSTSNELTNVEITDRGTGITIELFKKMCDVGINNSDYEALAEEIDSMPNWLKPTAGFGIGLQSIFLITDKFKIYTNTGSDKYYAEFNSQKTGGKLRLQNLDKEQAEKEKKGISRGSTICITFKMPYNFTFSWFGETDIFFNEKFDPMDTENHIGEIRILEAINQYCCNSIFPINIYCSETLFNSENKIFTFPLYNKWKSCDFDKNYYYRIDDDLKNVEIWNSNNAVYANLTLALTYINFQYQFKGIKINKNTPKYDKFGIVGNIDIYGFDTKQTIHLNRNSFIEKGREKIREVTNEILVFYKKLIFKILNNEITNDKKDNIDICSFWFLCDPKERSQISKEIISNNKSNNTKIVDIFEKEDNKFIRKTLNIKDILPNIENVSFINQNRFLEKNTNKYDLELIEKVLNENIDEIESKIIIISELFQDISLEYYIRTVKFCTRHKEKLLIYYNISSEINEGIEMDLTTREKFILALGKKIDEITYINDLNKQNLRYAMPMLKDYKIITVKRLNYSIPTMQLFCQNKLCIISPFCKDDLNTLEEYKLSKEKFVETVMNSPKFQNLVKYVQENYYSEKDKPTEDEIKNKYKELIEEYYDVTHPQA